MDFWDLAIPEEMLLLCYILTKPSRYPLTCDQRLLLRCASLTCLEPWTAEDAMLCYVMGALFALSI